MTIDNQVQITAPLGVVLAVAVAVAVFTATDSHAQLSPHDHLRETDAALQLFEAEDYRGFVALAPALLQANPWNGQLWAAYGQSLLAQDRFLESIGALERAVENGAGRRDAAYNLACAHARLGGSEAALMWLERALDAKFSDWSLLRTDADLDALRSEPRFLELLGDPPAGLSRDERWAHDLRFLVMRMEALHYNLYENISPAEFRAAIEALQREVSGLSDARIVLRLQRVIARVGDGHTRVGTITSEGGKRFPIGLYWYSDGVFVRGSVHPSADHLVGAQVVTVGGRPIEEVLVAATAYVSRDNGMGVRRLAPFYLGQPVAIEDMGLASPDGAVTLGVVTRSGECLEATVAPETGPWTHRVSANQGATEPPPLYLRHLNEHFGFEHLAEHDLVYIWLNQIANAPHETLEAFVGRVFDYIDDHAVGAVAIDVRNNGGGNNFLNDALVDRVARTGAINRRGRLFVITGRLTFSAAVDLVADLQRETNALVVGEPGAAGPNVVGEPRTIVLPCSLIEIRCSTLYFQRSYAQDTRDYIWPDLPAELSSSDFAANRDPALETILLYLDGVE